MSGGKWGSTAQEKVSDRPYAGAAKCPETAAYREAVEKKGHTDTEAGGRTEDGQVWMLMMGMCVVCVVCVAAVGGWGAEGR